MLLYNNADVFMLCFDLSVSDTLENVKEKWIPELQKLAPRHVPVVLCGLKSDVREEIAEYDKRIVTTERG